MQVEKTIQNRDLDAVKNFIIGVDYIDEVANNVKMKNHYFERIAKNELGIDDLINGTFIQDSSKNTPKQKEDVQELEKSNINILEKEKSIIDYLNGHKNNTSQLNSSRKDSTAVSQIKTLHPSSVRNSVIEGRERNNSETKYKSQKIINPDGISLSVQNEYQITEELMHQTIQGIVKNKLDRKNEDQSGQNKSSVHRNSALLNQLKKYKMKETTQSVPVSPNISPVPSLTAIINTPKRELSNEDKKQSNEEDKIEDSQLDIRSKGGFWNITKNVLRASGLNNNTASLVTEDDQIINTKSQDSKIDQYIKTPKQKHEKKKWVDSYTMSFQETLKRNMMEKFKDPSLNASRLKQHLKQSAISQIPDDDFSNIPEKILKKTQVVVPEMDEKIKLFQRAVMKNFGIQKQKSTSFIKDLSDKLKQGRVMSIHDGFVNHLQNSITKPDQYEQTPQYSQMHQDYSSSPFFRSNSVKDQSIATNQSINFKEHQGELKIHRFNTTASTRQSQRDQNFNNNGFLSPQIHPQRRLKTASDWNSISYQKQNQYSPNIFQKTPSSSHNQQIAQKRINSASYSSSNNNSINNSNIYNSTYSLYNKNNVQNKIKVQNSPKGYSFYENQSKKLYMSRMKSQSINSNPTTSIQYQHTLQPQNQNQISIRNQQNTIKKNDSNSNIQQISGYQQKQDDQIKDYKQQKTESNIQNNVLNVSQNISENDTNNTQQQNATLQIPLATINRPSIFSSLSQTNSQYLQQTNSQAKKNLQIQTEAEMNKNYILKFPSHDTVQEDVSKNDQSNKSLESFALDDGKIDQKYGTPRVFSPVFSPINIPEDQTQMTDTVQSGFAQKNPFNFKQIFSPLSAGQSPINQNQLMKEIEQLSHPNQNNKNQKNENILNEEQNQNDYFNNKQDYKDMKDMNFRFKIPSQNKQSQNQNLNQQDKPTINVINTKNEQLRNSRLNSCTSPASVNTSVKNMSSILGNSMSRKQRDQEYDKTLIYKHIQNRRFFSLMTDQCDEEDKNFNVQELRKCYKFQDQNPFFTAQIVDEQNPNLSLKNQRKLSQNHNDQYQFENDLKEQQDLLVKQMNSIQSAEKQLHQQRPKTNSLFLRSKNLQQISLQNIMDLQKNIHKRNKTEIPSKLQAKQTNSPIYKFQVEKLYNDKIRYIKAQQQNEEIQRKNEFFIKISQQQTQANQANLANQANQKEQK